LLLATYCVRPNIAVQVDSTLNDAQPFATPFKFTNTGVLSLRDLPFTVALNTRQLRTLPGREIQLLPMPEIADLLPGDSVTEFIPIAFGKGEGNPAIRLEGGVAPVDMKFFAHFKVAVWPFLITRSFRFVTIGDLSGHLRWFQVPVNDTRDWIDTK
jgi:hypothetical protein